MTSKEDVNEKLKAPIFIGNSTGIKQQQQQPAKIMDVPMSGDGDEDEEDGKLILVMRETTSTSYHNIKDKKKHSFDGVFVHNVNKHPVVETISREESLKAIYLLDKGMFPLLHL